MVSKYLNHVYPSTKQFKDAESLVLGKLMEVSIFGLNIAIVQHFERLCDSFQIDFNESYTEYFRDSVIGLDYTNLERNVPVKWKNRTIFRPDIIKGKCVIQDIELLQDVDHSIIWHWAIEMNNETKRRKNNEKKID